MLGGLQTPTGCCGQLKLPAYNVEMKPPRLMPGRLFVLSAGTDGRYAAPTRRGQPVCLARKKAIATIAIPIGIVITSIQYQAAATVIAPAATRPMPSHGLRLQIGRAHV